MSEAKQINITDNYKVVPALCLDLDGTVRRSKSGAVFIQNWEDIELMPGIEKIIWKYRDAGWVIFGVSNQAGVAHGFKAPGDVHKELVSTLALFEKNPFHGIQTCFFDKAGKIFPYNFRSLSRKPDYGMLVTLELEAYEMNYIVDWDESLFVGDRIEDEKCARNAQIKFQHIDQFLTGPHEIKMVAKDEDE